MLLNPLRIVATEDGPTIATLTPAIAVIVYADCIS